ncbi:allantoinase AllB [Streptomyces sp. NPDC005438]|uniref:allantoinase AllB n=1 Tax=Streptomyces sp. NPDC005438 TaxID=3156880 RepID=UPI0033A90E88
MPSGPADQPRRWLRSERVVTPEGTRPATVAVEEGRITALLPPDATPPEGVPLEDLGALALTPGLVDTHVHVNDPGRSHWETFAHATRAAAAGGVTTLVDMPLNSLPPTTTVEHLDVKRRTARDRIAVDVGFWGGAVPDNEADRPALHRAGVWGFKAFLSPSGVEEFPELDLAALERAVRQTAELGALLIVHAEDPDTLSAAPPAHGERYRSFLDSRPPEAELRAVARLLELAERHAARVHVLHLSSAEVLPLIARARARGVAVTVESCPHFLTLTAEEVPDGATSFKSCPPIRDADNRERLWRGLADGLIDAVVSDHSPCTPDLKVEDFQRAWGGVSSLQLGLSAMWTEARERGHPLERLAHWMATGPAALLGLDHKGAIEEGRDADLVAWDPEAAFTVRPEELAHLNPVSAYAGRRLHGTVRTTWLRGHPVYQDGRWAPPRGRFVERRP